MNYLRGKVAVITGAGSGIGRALAVQLVAGAFKEFAPYAFLKLDMK